MSPAGDQVKRIHEYAIALGREESLDTFSRRAVEGAVTLLEFDRAELLLYLETSHEAQGTWGHDSAGRLRPESGSRAVMGGEMDSLVQAMNHPEKVLYDNAANIRSWDGPVGRGGRAIVVLAEGERVLGWFCADNGVTGRELSADQREGILLYGQSISVPLQRLQYREVVNRYKAQNELKDRLFTILAHDLRGPIGNLAAMLGMVCDQPMDEESLQEVLSESRQAALRTYNLVENVLGWVRGQLDEIAALRERIPLSRPLIAVQIWLESSAKAKAVHLVLDCSPSLSAVTDERMVETIVRNLVSNAIKYSPRGATVLLRGCRYEDDIGVEVIDKGTGVPPDKLQTLFGRTQNRSAPGTAGEGGNGLGLMFSADLARTLGGRLEAESVLGQGSTFRLRLPDVVDGEL